MNTFLMRPSSSGVPLKIFPSEKNLFAIAHARATVRKISSVADIIVNVIIYTFTTMRD